MTGAPFSAFFRLLQLVSPTIGLRAAHEIFVTAQARAFKYAAGPCGHDGGT
jgi:hypothetical protein